MIKNLFKYISILVLVLLSLFLVSCDSSEVEVNPTLKISCEESIRVGSEVPATVEIINGVKDNTDLVWATSDASTVSVDNGIVKGNKVGKATITVTYMDKCSASLEIDVCESISSIDFTLGEVKLDFGDSYQLNYNVNPSSYTPKVEFISDNTKVATVNETGLVTAVGIGDAVITVNAIDGSGASSKMLISVVDNEAPVVTFKDEQNIRVAWNTEWNPTADITVIDNVDGDITNKVQVISNDVDTLYYKTYSVVYLVQDSSNNRITFVREVEVYWPYSCIIIGHGLGYYGIMNTEEAARNAINKMHYPMLEVDIYTTKDGVFVCSHDASFGGIAIKTSNWDDLKDVKITQTRHSGYPAQYGLAPDTPYTSGILRLDTLLDICKEYNTKLKIELKQLFTDKQMADLMKLLEDHNVMDLISFTAGSSLKPNLIWIREQGYKNEIQYLAWTCESQTTLDFCIKYNINVSICVTYGNYANSDEWIKKYKDAGLKVSCFTFQYTEDYSVVQKWIDKGVDFCTVDWHDPKVLKLPLAK